MGFGGNRFLIGFLFLFPQGARPFGRSLCTLGGRYSPLFPFCPLFPARRYGARPKKRVAALRRACDSAFLAGGRFSALSVQPLSVFRSAVARGKNRGLVVFSAGGLSNLNYLILVTLFRHSRDDHVTI